MADFQPLALPAYLVNEKAVDKFKEKIIKIPDHEPPFGVSLVEPQALLEHMGIGTIEAHEGEKDVAPAQRVQFYKTIETTRIAELPKIDNYPDEYVRFLEILKIRVLREKKDGKETITFIDTKTGEILNEHYVRQYLFFGLVVRTAMLARILHYDLKGTGSNDWGSIFLAGNMSPITVFDYDTIQLLGFYLDVTEKEIKKGQEKDEQYICGDERSLLYHFSSLLDITKAFESPRNRSVYVIINYWRLFYEKKWSFLLSPFVLGDEEIGKRLLAFIKQRRGLPVEPVEMEIFEAAA